MNSALMFRRTRGTISLIALLGVCTFGLLNLGQPSRCFACSPLPQQLVSRSTIPFPNAKSVALNSEVIVLYQGSVPAMGSSPDAGDLGPLGSDLVLLDTTTNTEVDVKILPLVWLASGFRTTAFRLKPMSLLRPNARYEVADRRGAVPCGFGQTCPQGALATFSSFETGVASDSDPPAFGGLAGVETRESKCDNGGCCGPYDATLATLRWARAADSSQFLLYGLYVDGVLKGYTAAESVTFNVCTTGYYNPDHVYLAPGSFRIDAVDLSGNAAMATVEKSLVPNVCALTATPDAAPHDGAAAATPDAALLDGARGDGAGEATRDQDGCSCRIGGRDSGAGMGVLLGLIALALCRKRASS